MAKRNPWLICLAVIVVALAVWYVIVQSNKERYTSDEVPQEGEGVHPEVAGLETPPPEIEFIPGLDEIQMVPPIEYGAGTFGFGRHTGVN